MQTLEGKEIATLLTPCTVTLVTARDAQGECVATCAWANPVSHEPSMIGVCLRPEGRTARAIAEGAAFCVNVLPSDAGSLAVACGRKGPDQPERFEAAGLEAQPCEHIDAVRIGQAMSWIECKLVDVRAYGDHTLYVGETLVAQTRGGEPLLMKGRSAFGAFAENEEA